METWVAHHSCPKATLRVEPLPGAAHAASSVRLLHTARAAGVHTIWFVGDSMHTPEAYVASCLAFREAAQMGERVLWTPKQPLWKLPAWANQSWVRRSFEKGYPPSCANLPGLRLCYIRHAHNALQPLAPLAALLNHSQEVGMRSTDVAWINVGLWFLGSGRDNEMIQAVESVIRLAAARRNASRTPAFFFRETYATHFPPKGIFQRLIRTTEVPRCAQLPENTSKFAILANVSAMLSISWDITTVSMWDESIAAHNWHSIESSLNTKWTLLDCSHYCVSSGLYHLAAQKLEAALSHVHVPPHDPSRPACTAAAKSNTAAENATTAVADFRQGSSG